MATEMETTAELTPTAPSTTYTCFACRVGFATAELQRLHYKTDWHRYNLKRKVASMPPLTAEGFRERVAAQRTEVAKAAAEAETEHSCKTCSKRFASRNALQTHFNSKKHKDREAYEAHRLANPEMAAATPATEGQEGDAAPSASGSFRSGTAFPPSRRQPLEEQRRKYAELDRLAAAELDREAAAAKAAAKAPKAAAVTTVDAAPAAADVNPAVADTNPAADAAPADEVASVLDTPVLELVDSLFDGYRGTDLEDTLRHMSQAHSFFIPHLDYVADLPGLMRYLQVKVGNYFTCITCNRPYNSLEGIRAHMEDKGHKAIDYDEAGQDELGPYYDFSATYPDNDQIDDSVRDMVLADDSGPQAIRVQDMELVLPSGRTLGHRELRRYYKQQFKPVDTRESIAVARVMAQYKALGHKGFTMPSETIRRDQAYVARRTKFHQLDISVNANRLQKHFRAQIMM